MSARPLNPARIGLCLSLAAALAGCSGFSLSPGQIAEVVKPYRIDVIQGNVITSEQLRGLRAGLDRQAVRDLLGTPLMQHVFHADRWDYVFKFKRQGEEAQLRRVTVFFKGEMVDRFEADNLPTESEFVATLVGRTQTGKPPVLEASEEALKAFPAPKSAAARPPAPATPASYPPLESSNP